MNLQYECNSFMVSLQPERHRARRICPFCGGTAFIHGCFSFSFSHSLRLMGWLMDDRPWALGEEEEEDEFSFENISL